MRELRATLLTALSYFVLTGYDALAPTALRIRLPYGYNLQGVCRWKELFDPVWRPRYLAAPGGLKLPTVVRDVTALVSGGVRGIFKK